MQANRRLWVIVGTVLLLVLAVGGFFLWLTGGGRSRAEQAPQDLGFAHVRSIYLYDGGTPLSKPVGIGADSGGGFFVTLRDGNVVVEFDDDGDYVRHWGSKGMNPGNLLAPLGVAVDRSAGHVYVVDRSRLRLVCFSGSGSFLWEQPVLNPTSVSVGAGGDVFVTTFGPVVRYSSQGEFVGELGIRGNGELQFDFPRQITTDDRGLAYIADSNNGRVQKVRFTEDAETTPTLDWVVGIPPAGSEAPRGLFVNPTGVATSPRGLVVVLDGFQHVVRMLDDDDGTVLTDFGGERRGSSDGAFNLPTQIAHLSGDLYAVTDTYNDRVQIVRLVEPGTLNPFRRFPWLMWLLPLLLLPLLSMLRRKRAFVPRETLERAVEQGNARLLIGVYRKLHVLPEVAEEFEDITEEKARLGDYFEVVEYRAPDTKPEPGENPIPPVALEDLTPEQRLAGAAQPSRLERALLARHVVVCVDSAQCEVFVDLECATVEYDRIIEEYALPEKKTK